MTQKISTERVLKVFVSYGSYQQIYGQNKEGSWTGSKGRHGQENEGRERLRPNPKKFSSGQSQKERAKNKFRPRCVGQA